ncbi:MAG: CubicO group peptidase (beta-lactamase class C family) [Candidatus Poriferisodalaceae bacterium]|jgi:CubicO group peptidase (beta-lactamase class C family)
MSKHSRWTFAAGLIAVAMVVASCYCSQPSPINTSPAATNLIETSAFNEFVEVLDAERKAHNIPGLAFAVTQESNMSAHGLGATQTGTNDEVRADTIFHIGSAQKSLNAMFIATLVDDGLMEWDGPLVDLIDIELAANAELLAATNVSSSTGSSIRSA